MRCKIRPADLTAIRLNDSDTVRSVTQNIALILSTKRGTVPMYRDFGLDWRMLDKPMPAALPLLQVGVKEAIEEFEPRAEVRNIRFVTDASQPGKLIPEVEVEINEQQES